MIIKVMFKVPHTTRLCTLSTRKNFQTLNLAHALEPLTSPAHASCCMGVHASCCMDVRGPLDMHPVAWTCMDHWTCFPLHGRAWTTGHASCCMDMHGPLDMHPVPHTKHATTCMGSRFAPCLCLLCVICFHISQFHRMGRCCSGIICEGRCSISAFVCTLKTHNVCCLRTHHIVCTLHLHFIVCTLQTHNVCCLLTLYPLQSGLG